MLLLACAPLCPRVSCRGSLLQSSHCSLQASKRSLKLVAVGFLLAAAPFKCPSACLQLLRGGVQLGSGLSSSGRKPQEVFSLELLLLLRALKLPKPQLQSCLPKVWR